MAGSSGEMTDVGPQQDSFTSLPASCALRTGSKVPLKYGTQEPVLRAQEVRSRNRRAQARYRVRQRAKKQDQDTQERTMCDTIALLQSNNTMLADRNGQLESSLWHICKQVKEFSEVQASKTDVNSSSASRKALTLATELRDDADTSRADAGTSDTRAHLISASVPDLVELLKELMMSLHRAVQMGDSDAILQAAIKKYLHVCCTLKDLRPSILRHLELMDLETCTAAGDRDPAKQKQHWTSIIDVCELTMQQKQSLVELRRAYVSSCRSLLGLQTQLQQASSACMSMSADSSAASVHNNLSDLQVLLKGESDAWHALQVRALTQVLKPRQAALWIVLAWPRMYDVMALVDIAAEDLAIACCFQSMAAPDMLHSPTSKLGVSRRLAFPPSDPITPSSSSEAPTFPANLPSSHATFTPSTTALTALAPSTALVPSGPSRVRSTLPGFPQTPLAHSPLAQSPLVLEQPSQVAPARAFGRALGGYGRMHQPHAPCTPPCPSVKSFSPDSRRMGNLEAERVHSNHTPITAFLQDLAHWQGQGN